jgi:hypothetical protein
MTADDGYDVSDAELELAAGGMIIRERDLDYGDDLVVGLVLIETGEDPPFRVVLLVRPGLQAWQRAGFAKWAVIAVGRFMEHGPDLDGWLKRSDGRWQQLVQGEKFPSPD